MSTSIIKPSKAKSWKNRRFPPKKSGESLQVSIEPFWGLHVKKIRRIDTVREHAEFDKYERGHAILA